MSRLSLISVLVFLGCGSTLPPEEKSEIGDRRTESSAAKLHSFDIDEHLWKELQVEGVLEGNWILGQDGHDFGVTHKGRDPMRIRFHSVPLALGGETNELVKQMLVEAGNRVRLTGIIRRIQVDGRGRTAGQAGYSGPIPAHVVYYMEVSACERIHETPVEKTRR